MQLPTPPQAVAALAAFVRERLSDVSDTLAPLWARGEAELLPARAGEPDPSASASARQLAMAIVGAVAPFATTAYSRARLLRQMHASGLLSDEHAERTARLLELAGAGDSGGAPQR